VDTIKVGRKEWRNLKTHGEQYCSRDSARMTETIKEKKLHIPELLNEVIHSLNIKPDSYYIDAH
jgi:hypothetical protein